MTKVKDDSGHEHGADGKFTGSGGGGSGKAAKPKRISLVTQARSMKLKELKELPLAKLRAMQTALQRHDWPEEMAKNKKALRMVEGAIYSKV